MHKSDLKIIREAKDNIIEFYTNKSLEPNSSYEIENCIKDRISPIKELKYKFDYWFDDNDSGYFIKDNIRIDIHYGVMMDFTFTIENKYSEIEMNKIENWIKDIYVCMLEKEKIRIENSVSNEKNQQNLELNVIEETEIAGIRIPFGVNLNIGSKDDEIGFNTYDRTMFFNTNKLNQNLGNGTEQSWPIYHMNGVFFTMPIINN